MVREVKTGYITIRSPFRPEDFYGVYVITDHISSVPTAARAMHQWWMQNRDPDKGITFILPCRNTIRLSQTEGIPPFDVPCPCGNSHHWLVKWFIVPTRNPITRN